MGCRSIQGSTTPPLPLPSYGEGLGDFSALLPRAEQGLAAPGHPGLVASLVGHRPGGWELGKGQGLSRGFGHHMWRSCWNSEPTAQARICSGMSIPEREGASISTGLSHSPPGRVGPPLPALVRGSGELKGQVLVTAWPGEHLNVHPGLHSHGIEVGFRLGDLRERQHRGNAVL